MKNPDKLSNYSITTDKSHSLSSKERSSTLNNLAQEIIHFDPPLITNETENSEPNRKPPAYWKNWNNLLTELTIFINQLYEYLPSNTSRAMIQSKILDALQTRILQFPTTHQFNKFGRQDIKNGFRYFGGIIGVLKKIKFASPQEINNPSQENTG